MSSSACDLCDNSFPSEHIRLDSCWQIFIQLVPMSQSAMCTHAPILHIYIHTIIICGQCCIQHFDSFRESTSILIYVYVYITKSTHRWMLKQQSNGLFHSRLWQLQYFGRTDIMWARFSAFHRPIRACLTNQDPTRTLYPSLCIYSVVMKSEDQTGMVVYYVCKIVVCVCVCSIRVHIYVLSVDGNIVGYVT